MDGNGKSTLIKWRFLAGKITDLNGPFLDAWQDGWLENEVSVRSSGERRERFGAMGIHIPYSMRSDLELPGVSQPHTSNGGFKWKIVQYDIDSRNDHQIVAHTHTQRVANSHSQSLTL